MTKILKNLLQIKEQSVFTIQEIAQICGISDKESLHSKLKYLTHTKNLIRIRRGFYVLSNDYSRFELGNKLRKPSYVSLYSTLQEEGVVFQYYESIFLVSNDSLEIKVNNEKYVYRKIKDEILLDTAGIVENKNTYKATLERALCDKIYLDGIEHFDNLKGVNWDFMHELNDTVYKNEKILKFIKSYEST